MQLALAAIDIPPGRRQVVPAKVDELALSIAELGLLAPPTVFAVPDVPGRYQVVAGATRILALRKLGYDEIDVRVTTADAIHREMIEISENVHRADLTIAERDAAMNRYAALYRSLHPGATPEELESGRKAHLRRGDRPGPAADAPASPAPRPDKAVAETFGVDPEVARRAIRRAGAFSDEERTVLDALNLDLRSIDAVAAVDDPADRAQVISLLATNMGLADALREVLGPAPPPASGPGPAAPPDDDEWLDSLPIRARVNGPAFDADALLYRAAQDARAAFERSLGWSDRRRAVGPRGPYHRRMERLLDAPHPRHWVLCPNCARGLKGGAPCNQCKGGGYLIG